MKKMISFFACILLLQVSQNAFCIEPDDTGLKTGGNLRVPVVVLSLTEAESNVGLDEERLLNTVRLQLRQNGLMPLSKEAAFSLGWYLGVDIMIAGSAYPVKIDFHREVTYQVGNKTSGKEDITWQMWYTGVHEVDSEIIIDRLLDCVDVFSNEFLEANED